MSEHTSFHQPNQKLIPTKRETKRGWNDEDELLLKEWADHAQCYRWLHERSYSLYERLNYNYSIPVIVLSNVTGTASFGVQSISIDYREYASMGIGVLNLIAGIISTVAQFKSIIPKLKTHLTSFVDWSKFYQNIRFELAKRPENRESVDKFMNDAKEEYSRLIEVSPLPPSSVIEQFNKTFKRVPISKPEICNSLKETPIYIRNENEQKVAEPAPNVVEENKQKYIEMFQKNRGRVPTAHELISGLKDIKVSVKVSDEEEIQGTDELSHI